MKYVLFFLLLSTAAVSAQVITAKPGYIEGVINGGVVNADSVYFIPGRIAAKYYERIRISSSVSQNRFRISNQVTYPQMYRLVFRSDSNIRIYRFGEYFIDPSTTAISFNYGNECNEVTGASGTEFTQKFLPYMFSGKKYMCDSNAFQELSSDPSAKFDTLLYTYVKLNPNSYVALWSLIERFSIFGHSIIRQEALSQFSVVIKKAKPWQLLSGDLQHAGIKERGKFPKLKLQTTELAATTLQLPKAKYTLVDYWFSRCRPCLDDIPQLKKIYARYKDKGFEIVSISTDKPKDVPIWQRRVKEYGLTWLQYLDLNGKNATGLGVDRFPSVFLLDQNGKVIKKYPSLDELEVFLSKQL